MKIDRPYVDPCPNGKYPATSRHKGRVVSTKQIKPGLFRNNMRCALCGGTWSEIEDHNVLGDIFAVYRSSK